MLMVVPAVVPSSKKGEIALRDIPVGTLFSGTFLRHHRCVLVIYGHQAVDLEDPSCTWTRPATITDYQPIDATLSIIAPR